MGVAGQVLFIFKITKMYSFQYTNLPNDPLLFYPIQHGRSHPFFSVLDVDSVTFFGHELDRARASTIVDH